MMDKKTTVSRENKKVILQQKQKVVKPKAVGVKAGIKAVPRKKQKGTKDKGKTKPAPIAEAGYALYSTDSEASLLKESDTCNVVLNMLREKRKGSHVTKTVIEEVRSAVQRHTGHDTAPPTVTDRPPVVIPSVTIDDEVPNPGHVTHQGIYTPFNVRLSSSTPDPERPQIIPERDTNSRKISAPQQSFQPVYTGSAFGQCPKTTESDRYSGQGIADFKGVTVVASGSEGFVPSQDAELWNRRDSDIRSFQAYIPRESTGFKPLLSKTDQIVAKDTLNISSGKNHSSGSSGEKERTRSSPFSQNTANSSGTEYIFLPRPVIETEGNSGTMPSIQVQNGLYQIRPLNPLSSVANQMIGAELIRIATPTTDENNKQNQGTAHDIGQTWEEPERDIDMKTTGKSVPTLDISPDSISTITGTETITPRSILTNTTVSDDRGKNLRGISSQNKHQIGNKAEREGGDSSENKTVSFNTQSSHFTVVTSEWSGSQNNRADILYQLVDTQAGRQLFPVQLIHHPVVSSCQHQPINYAGSSQKQNSPNSRPSNENSASASLQSSTSSKVNLQGQQQQQQQPIMDQDTDHEVLSPPNPWSRVRLDAGLKKLRYLVAEIKECGKISKDVEIGRLAREVEKTLECVPQLSATFSLQAEVDLALQPLRSENAQLRRKLRLANQQNRDQGTEKETPSQQVDFNVVRLQASNSALQKQIKDEKEMRVKLAAEVTDLNNQLQRMKIERNKLLTTLSEKETDGIKIKQECLSDAQKFRHEMEALKRETEAISLQQQASDQENHILQISLQQRDAEIDRLQNIVRTVKESVAELLQELESTGDKSLASNTSLHKLLRILGNDDKPAPSPGKSILSEPRHFSANKHNTVVKTLRFENDIRWDNHREQQAKLTQENLASHDKFQKFNDSVGIRKANSDSEVEITIDEFQRNSRWFPRQRRQSTSPVGRRESTESRHKRALSSSPRHVGRLSRIGVQDEQTNGSFMKMFRGIFNGPSSDDNNVILVSDTRPRQTRNPSSDIRVPAVGEYKTYLPQDSNIESNRSEASMSRYSVTEYFKKYPVPKDSIQGMDSDKFKRHHRAYSQPARFLPRGQTDTHLPQTSRPNPFTKQPTPVFNWSSNVHHPKTNTDVSSLQQGSTNHQPSPAHNWSSHVYASSAVDPKPSIKRPTPTKNWSSHVYNPTTSKPSPSDWRPTMSDPVETSPQDHLFQGTVLDNSISAIDDDNISSVSGSAKTISSSSTTVDESNFRKGIASLDANILKLQLALQKTKNMLN